MKLVAVILILLVAWLIYAIIQSYRSMAEELKEIRMKCIKKSDDDSDFTYNASDPANKMVSTLVNALQMVKDYAT
jgi:hypothetical protein